MGEKYSFGQKFLLRTASFLGAPLLFLYGATWRLGWEGIENLELAKKRSGRVLFCFWHCKLLGLCWSHRFRNVGIMVSKSFDGEWIKRIVTKLGYRVFRGSSSKDGATALAEMVKSEQKGDLALTVDGPRGPARKAKAGGVFLASKTGLPIVPISYVASRAWRLNSWDGFLIPKPFSRVVVRYGKQIDVPKNIDSERAKKICEQLEIFLNRMG